MEFAGRRGEADNGVVPNQRRIVLSFVAALCWSWTALPQTLARVHTPPPEARVDINHTAVEELLKVPGMTRTWADRIVRFRPYRTKIDLMDRGVVTSEVYDRIKDYVIARRDEQ
jgi:DNA uptake protein ComE-like DNA-binding protein